MAAKKTAAKKTAAKKAAVPTRAGQRLTRDTTLTPDPLDPSRPLPTRVPEYRDMNRAAQNQVTAHVAAAGAAAFGVRPIQMQDAVSRRVESIERGILESRNGVPEGYDWYSQHQSELRDTHAKSGIAPEVSIASVADAGASASQRNSPENELAATVSGLHNKANPDTQIQITPAHAAAANAATSNKSKFLKPAEHLVPGTARIGQLNHQQIAALAQVATTTHDAKSAKAINEAENRTGDDRVKAGDLVHGENPLPPEFTDVTGRSSSRSTSVKVMKNLEGVPLSASWKDAPKLFSYRRDISAASKPEDLYNASVFSRRAYLQSHPGQGMLFSAAEETGFDPSTAETSTAEDYVMQSQTAHKAAEGTTKRDAKGKLLRARDAQNVVNVTKGPRNQGITTDLTPKEAFHAFNNEATSRAARAINYVTFGPDGEPLSEHITSMAAQASSWIPYRRYELGEDKEWNADQAMRKAHASAHAKIQSNADKVEKAAQGTLIDSAGNAKVTKGRIIKPKAPRFTRAEQAALDFAAENPEWTGRHGLAEQ